jgi:hypothetical protein
MNEPPSEAKVPPLKMESADDEWRIHLYNQERVISTQLQITELLEKLLDQQRKVGELAIKLDEHLEISSMTMRESIKSTSGLITSIVKVPIAIVVVGAASWAFMYMNEISENTWLIILAVAVFPWLGDSITAITKLFGIGGRGNGGSKSPSSSSG